MDVDRSILIYALGLVGEAYGEGKAVKVAKGESTKGFNPSGRASPSAPARGSGPSRARRGGGGGPRPSRPGGPPEGEGDKGRGGGGDSWPGESNAPPPPPSSPDLVLTPSQERWARHDRLG